MKLVSRKRILQDSRCNVGEGGDSIKLVLKDPMSRLNDVRRIRDVLK